MRKQKFVPRLPAGVVKKLQENTGGGRHRDHKKDYKRNPKHRNCDSGEQNIARHLYQNHQLIGGSAEIIF